MSLLSCSPATPFLGQEPTVFGPEQYPDKLSDWQLLQHDGQQLHLNPAAVDYDINMPLFTDYAAKYRSLWLPPGTQATLKPDQSLAFPVGSLISKTFLYPLGHAGARELYRLEGARVDVRNAHLIETRLLVRQRDGWQTLTYLWRGDDAYLKRTGAVVPVRSKQHSDATFNYIVPSNNECASCHALNHRSGKLQPIGLKPAQLTSQTGRRPSALQRFIDRGWLAASISSPDPYAIWKPGAQQTSHHASNTDAQARDYLDSNCAHCHSPIGPAKTSGLDLTRANSELRSIGRCKPPIAAGKGSGNRLYSIVPGYPEQSILTYRLASTDPSRQMPEIGRSLVHAQGLAMVEQWIGTLQGTCR